MYKTLTHEQFIEKAKAKFPHIEVLSEYKGSQSVMTFRCVKHNHVFENTAYNFINSKFGCDVCAHEDKVNSRLVDADLFAEKLKESNPSVEQLTQYIGMQKKIRVKCKKCGNIWESKAQDLLKGHACKKCGLLSSAEKRLKTKEWFIEKLNKYNPHANEIDILGDYNGTKDFIRCKCKTCEYEWNTPAANLIDKRGGTGCPICNQSKGEALVGRYLIEHNVDFERQKSFDGLNGDAGFLLSYDFYVPSKRLLIEVNGEQHYNPVDYFGGEKKFKRQQRYDEKKRKYAKENNYELLEIKYDNKYFAKEMNSILQSYFS